MPIRDLLLPEFEEEMKKTRLTLARVPADQPDFAPHPKSMPLGKLAPHVAELAGFGLTILTTPELDFSTGRLTPLKFESPEQLGYDTLWIGESPQYKEVFTHSALLLASSPLAILVDRIGPIRRLSPWKAAIVRAFAMIVPVGAAVAIALALSPSPMEG